MPKLKTKSSVKKRFRLTASGKLRRSYAFKRHNMRKRTPKQNRQARGMTLVSVSDTPRLLKMMPYR